MRLPLLFTLLLIIDAGLLVQHLRTMPRTSLIPLGYRLRGWLLVAITFCLLFAVRGMTWKQHTASAETETMIMLDVSKSMLVQDTGTENASRLDMAKRKITELLASGRQHKRGLGIFAGETQGVLPLTPDGDLLLTFLAGLDHRNLTKQGSNLAEALDYAAARFSSGDHQKQLLLLSDGGEEEVTLPTQLQEVIKKQQIDLLIVGVGSAEGGPIPEGTDAFGAPVYKQWEGQSVISRLDAKALKKVAQELGGKYVSRSKFSPSDLARGGTGGWAVLSFTHVFLGLAIIGLILLLGIHLRGPPKLLLQLVNNTDWFS